ncbi:hypothetical protein JCGZ_20403 [Jatropha curcas]|uniref:ATP-dependent RNA helicase n=1 Tax=Jatropha curcas TaxID=180498 RepID=A0A067JN18_JATCU|nr:hypothetical protein JCGZ_20403 [Jatropha curcas]
MANHDQNPNQPPFSFPYTDQNQNQFYSLDQTPFHNFDAFYFGPSHNAPPQYVSPPHALHATSPQYASSQASNDPIYDPASFQYVPPPSASYDPGFMTSPPMYGSGFMTAPPMYGVAPSSASYAHNFMSSPPMYGEVNATPVNAIPIQDAPPTQGAMVSAPPARHFIDLSLSLKRTSMADTSETPATTTERQSKPQAAEIIKWGDVEDEEETASTSEDKVASQLEDKLTIDDSEKVDKFLEEPQDSNIQAVTAGDTPYTSATTFEDLNLTPELLKGLYVEMKFKKPSKIQAISLPMILTPPYKDLIAQAHNGSGKTTCFVLGMLSRIDPNARRPQALCICPTRELSIQNLEVLRKMGKYTGITSECAVPMDSANDRPRSRPPIFAQVVIGTPGTIKRLMSQKKLSVTDMRVLVFDEADHMLAKDGCNFYYR